MVLPYFNPFVLGGFLVVGVITAIVAITTTHAHNKRKQVYRERPRSPPLQYETTPYDEIRRNANNGNTQQNNTTRSSPPKESLRSRRPSTLSQASTSTAAVEKTVGSNVSINGDPQEWQPKPESLASSESSRSASPTVSETSTTKWSLMGDLDKLCGICETEVSRADRYIPPCGDIFHEGCYLDWFKDNMPKGCPTCDFCLINSY